MSIWIDGELAEHSYEKTFIVSRTALGVEQLIIWIEGTNMDLSFKDKIQEFGMVGGNINTNTGVIFTKDMLLEIASKMKEGAEMRIAACNELSIKEVKDDFEKDNDMIKIDKYSFKPKSKL